MKYSELNNFKKIIFINLDHREDRKKLILAQLQAYGVHKSKIHRIPAYYDKLNKRLYHQPYHGTGLCN